MHFVAFKAIKSLLNFEMRSQVNSRRSGCSALPRITSGVELCTPPPRFNQWRGSCIMTKVQQININNQRNFRTHRWVTLSPKDKNFCSFTNLQIFVGLSKITWCLFNNLCSERRVVRFHSVSLWQKKTSLFSVCTHESSHETRFICL